jgi:hypothetical protein
MIERILLVLPLKDAPADATRLQGLQPDRRRGFYCYYCGTRDLCLMMELVLGIA